MLAGIRVTYHIRRWRLRRHRWQATLGAPVGLDDLRRRTRPRRHAPLPALSPRAGLAGHGERSRHVDRSPHATRRPAVRLTRGPARPQPAWPATPLMSPLWPGLVWGWRGLLVGTLARAWPGVSAAWPVVSGKARKVNTSSLRIIAESEGRLFRKFAARLAGRRDLDGPSAARCSRPCPPGRW